MGIYISTQIRSRNFQLNQISYEFFLLFFFLIRSLLWVNEFICFVNFDGQLTSSDERKSQSRCWNAEVFLIWDMFNVHNLAYATILQHNSVQLNRNYLKETCLLLYPVWQGKDTLLQARLGVKQSAVCIWYTIYNEERRLNKNEQTLYEYQQKNNN